MLKMHRADAAFAALPYQGMRQESDNTNIVELSRIYPDRYDRILEPAKGVHELVAVRRRTSNRLSSMIYKRKPLAT